MEEKPVVHGFDGKSASPASSFSKKPTGEKGNGMGKKQILLFLVVVLLGGFTGFAFASQKSDVVNVTDKTDISSLPVGTVFGSDDEKEFDTTAEGLLKPGGVEGEGSHHLERPGGASQTVYLTSSVLDLSELEGRTVKVWGKTYDAQTAGWFMDVGRAQILK